MCFKLLLFYFAHMSVLPALPVSHMHAVPVVARRGQQIPWDYRSRCCELPRGCWDPIWVLLEELPVLLRRELSLLHFLKRYFGDFQRGTPFFSLRIKSSRTVLLNGGDFSLCVIFSFLLNVEKGWDKMGTDGWVK